MAVSSAQVVTPLGRLDPEVLWPTLSTAKVEEKLDGFLLDAEERVVDLAEADQDEATIQWVYYRAYDEVYQRMVAEPSSVTANDEGSSSYTQAQIELMRELRDTALAEFDDLLDEEVEEEDQFVTLRSLRD